MIERFELKLDIEESLNKALVGDEEVNAITRSDPRLAHMVAHAIKSAYEKALEDIDRAKQYDEDYMQTELIKGPITWLTLVDGRASRAVDLYESSKIN